MPRDEARDTRQETTAAAIDAAARREAVDSGTSPVPLRRLWIGVALAPGVWVVGGLAGYYLAARSCDRIGGVPLTGTSAPATTHVVLELVMAIIATYGLLTALKNMRATRPSSKPAEPPAMGRAHFLALTGAIASAVFLFGIVLIGFSGFVVDACRQGR